MFFVDDERWTSYVTLAGAMLWVVLAALAGSGRVPFGVIELLFLFAPLVVVPLGLALLDSLSVTRAPAVELAARTVQPLAALSLVVGFWCAPGIVAGLMAIPWAIVCGAIALAGLLRLSTRKSLADVVGSIARIDLGIAGLFLLLSRFGVPLRFSEPIVLLTAVHFHYSGFATSVIALAGLRFADHSTQRRLWQFVVVAVVTLPFSLATGFVFSSSLKVVSAVFFSATVTAVGLLLLKQASTFSCRTARFFLRVAATSVAAAMALAATYAVGEYLHRGWLTIPRMASTHGWINAVGFVTPALLGCLAELRSEREGLSDCSVSRSRNRRPQTTEISRPTFIAREFYDF